MRDAEYDFVIVGAGPAGCVLASRLSADPAIRVALIEAGDDALPGQEHRDVRDPYPVSMGDPRFTWPGLTSAFSTAPDRPTTDIPFAQGLGIGGGANVYGMVGFRGLPADYDEWRSGGARGWGWSDVLPHFLRVERDLDFKSAEHGVDGLMPVRRVLPDQWSPFARSVADALVARGYPVLDDLNTQFDDGIGPMPMLNLPDRRVSAAMAYLDEAVRRRPNLDIVAQSHVEQIVIEGEAATGVRTGTPLGPRVLTAKEIIVSAGALQSPALLMRSGIGPAAHLRSVGIDVKVALEGVGQRLMNHPAVTFAAFLPKRSKQRPDQRGWGQNLLRYSSSEPGCEPHDMAAYILNKTAWHALGERVGAYIVSVNKSHSLGAVRLKNGESTSYPDVQYTLCEQDIARLVSGVRLGLEVLASPQVRKARCEVFLPNSPLIGTLGPRNARNRIVAAGLAGMLGLNADVRGRLLRSLTVDPAALAKDEGALRELVLQQTWPAYHIAGTCRMGDASDPATVVDSDCRVLGVDRLRVVDASIMPNIVSGGTHLPVLMIAEKMASSIAAEARHGPADALALAS